MKKLLTLLLFAGALLSAQIVTVTFSGFQPAVLSDLNTHWLGQTGPSFGVTSGAIDSTTSTVTVTISQASLSAAQPIPVVGQSVLIDAEPCVVAPGSTGNTLILLRGTLPLAVLTTHASGISIFPLVYPDPWTMMNVEAILPWSQRISVGLGAKSAVFGSSISGVVTQ